jgi:hypothetical protein
MRAYDHKQYLGTLLKEINIQKSVEKIPKKGKEILHFSYELLVCSRSAGIRSFFNNYFDSYQKVMERYRKASVKAVR